MKRRTLITAAVGLLLWPLRAFGALTDAQAMSLAIRTFGPKAMIGHVRGAGDSNWTKQVGYWNGLSFVVIGRGFNTWDAAYANVPPENSVQPPLADMRSYKIGRLLVDYDLHERALIRQDLVNASGESIAIDPTTSYTLTSHAEERLSLVIQEMLTLYPNEAAEIMQTYGVRLTVR